MEYLYNDSIDDVKIYCCHVALAAIIKSIFVSMFSCCQNKQQNLNFLSEGVIENSMEQSEAVDGKSCGSYG